MLIGRPFSITSLFPLGFGCRSQEGEAWWGCPAETACRSTTIIITNPAGSYCRNWTSYQPFPLPAGWLQGIKAQRWQKVLENSRRNHFTTRISIFVFTSVPVSVTCKNQWIIQFACTCSKTWTVLTVRSQLQVLRTVQAPISRKCLPKSDVCVTETGAQEGPS